MLYFIHCLAVKNTEGNELEIVIVRQEHKETGAKAPMDREWKESACAGAHKEEDTIIVGRSCMPDSNKCARDK